MLKVYVTKSLVDFESYPFFDYDLPNARALWGTQKWTLAISDQSHQRCSLKVTGSTGTLWLQMLWFNYLSTFIELVDHRPKFLQIVTWNLPRGVKFPLQPAILSRFCSSMIVETSYFLKVSFQIAKRKISNVTSLWFQNHQNNTTFWAGFGKSCIAQQLHHGRSVNLRECHDMLKQRRGRSEHGLICCPESQEAQGSKRFLKCNNWLVFTSIIILTLESCSIIMCYMIWSFPESFCLWS